MFVLRRINRVITASIAIHTTFLLEVNVKSGPQIQEPTDTLPLRKYFDERKNKF
jgi:hypothetical protein